MRRCKAAAGNDFCRRRSRSVEEEDPVGPAVLAESAEMEVPVAEPEEASKRGRRPKTSEKEERSSKSTKGRTSSQCKTHRKNSHVTGRKKSLRDFA